jgi:hypothetical protein
MPQPMVQRFSALALELCQDLASYLSLLRPGFIRQKVSLEFFALT